LGWVSGEDMWARSTIQALRDMGYTFLYSSSMGQTVQLYHMIPNLVKVVIMESDDTFVCFEDEENCILSVANPEGIPAWKILSFHFWSDAGNPLGRKWTLSPEEYALAGLTPNTYLGYSVEHSCMSQAFVPHDDREDSAYVMTKRLARLRNAEERAWPPHFYEAASNMTGIEFVLGANDDGSHRDVPPGITNYGVLEQPAFMDALSKSVVLIGVGSPSTSPTPYEGLCLGVPFINPILDWNRDDPKDRTSWQAQHWMLKLLDPPFVYNVFKDDFDGFVDAIDNAILHPIDRYMLDRMRMSSVALRIRAILETDWKREAAKLLARRQATGEVPLFKL